MEKEEYLNYTRGTTLQSIIQQIVNEAKTGKDLSELKKWLVNEQRNLRKKQSSFWQPTISDSCYYRYLDILIEMLSSDKEVSHYQTLSLKISNMTRKKVYALFLTEEVCSMLPNKILSARPPWSMCRFFIKISLNK